MAFTGKKLTIPRDRVLELSRMPFTSISPHSARIDHLFHAVAN